CQTVRSVYLWGPKCQLELYLDLLAQRQLVDADGHVEVDAVVATADRGLGAEAGVLAAVHGVGVDAVELDGEVDRPGDAVDGQLALELVLVAAARDAGGAELERGVALDAEEVGGAQVVVAVGLVGV